MAIVAEPRALAELAEIDPQLPQGRGERFSGYGVMGQPFASGHILALRRFPISSLGYGYTAVWHRSPAGEWTFWSDVEPRASCARFFGNAIDRVVVAPIAVRWTSPHSLTVSVGNHDLDWTMTLSSAPATVVLNVGGSLLPDGLWRHPRVLDVVSSVAGRALGAGRITMHGSAPNGQRFVVNPTQVWLVDRVRAVLHGVPFGEPGPVRPQAVLGDFAVPQRGLFSLGRAFFEPFDPDRHLAAVTRQGTSALR